MKLILISILCLWFLVDRYWSICYIWFVMLTRRFKEELQWLLLTFVPLMMKEQSSLITMVYHLIYKIVVQLLLYCCIWERFFMFYCFVNAGLELLLGLLGSTNLKQQQDGSVALYKLANKAMSLSPMDAAPPSPTPQVCLFLSVSANILKFQSLTDTWDG